MSIEYILTSARDEYYNIGESSLTDIEYDILEEKLRNIDPANKFFTGIGAPIRTDKVKLPHKMGSLTQIYDDVDLTTWAENHDIVKSDLTISSKMDGVSVQIVYDSDGKFQISYSRGNGIEGQDISRHIIMIDNVPNNIDVDITTTIRSECIISKSKFKDFQTECIDRNYKVYKNPRNAVAGLLNSKIIPEWIYKYLEIITYELIGSYGKVEQFTILNDLGFDVVWYKTLPYCDISQFSLEKMVLYTKNEGPYIDYEQDGVVIDINSSELRSKVNPSTNTLNPEYSRKFKIQEDVNVVQSTVVNVIWTPSKNGLIKPTIKIEPIELNGVTITSTNGFNAKYIIDNKINTGSHLMMIRSGDVIPYILSVLSESDTPNIPDSNDYGEYDWNETKVDYVLLEENDIVIKKGIESFFSSLDISNIGPGVVNKLFNLGYTDISSVININKQDFIDIVGKNGSKIYDNINARLNDVTEYEFMGSLPYFIGIGKRMFEKIYDHYGICSDLTFEQIIEVKGFDDKTAIMVLNNYDRYYDIILDINKDLIFKDKVIHRGILDDTIWVFTKYRNKDAETIIKNNGGTIGSGVKSGTTYLVTTDTTGTSNKLKSARKLGIKIIDPDEMSNILDNL